MARQEIFFRIFEDVVRALGKRRGIGVKAAVVHCQHPAGPDGRVEGGGAVEDAGKGRVAAASAALRGKVEERHASSHTEVAGVDAVPAGHEAERLDDGLRVHAAADSERGVAREQQVSQGALTGACHTRFLGLRDNLVQTGFLEHDRFNVRLVPARDIRTGQAHCVIDVD